jgi:hypothetical protein
MAQTTAHPFLPDCWDRLPFPAGLIPPGWFLAPHLFFSARTPSARQSHPIDWALGQFVFEFLASTLNRFRIHAGDLRQQLVSLRADPIGLQGYIPATLLFIQATEQEVHLAMQDLVGMQRMLLTGGTLTLMNLWC